MRMPFAGAVSRDIPDLRSLAVDLVPAGAYTWQVVQLPRYGEVDASVRNVDGLLSPWPLNPFFLPQADGAWATRASAPSRPSRDALRRAPSATAGSARRANLGNVDRAALLALYDQFERRRRRRGRPPRRAHRPPDASRGDCAAGPLGSSGAIWRGPTSTPRSPVRSPIGRRWARKWSGSTSPTTRRRTCARAWPLPASCPKSPRRSSRSTCRPSHVWANDDARHDVRAFGLEGVEDAAAVIAAVWPGRWPPSGRASRASSRPPPSARASTSRTKTGTPRRPRGRRPVGRGPRSWVCGVAPPCRAPRPRPLPGARRGQGPGGARPRLPVRHGRRGAHERPDPRAARVRPAHGDHAVRVVAAPAVAWSRYAHLPQEVPRARVRVRATPSKGWPASSPPTTRSRPAASSTSAPASS